MTKSLDGSALKHPSADQGASRNKRWLRKLVFSLIPALVLFCGMELALRARGFPREKYTIGEFGFPPAELYETAFRRDPVRFWRLAPGFSGQWDLYKSKYTHERQLSPNIVHDRVRHFPDTSYYRTVTWGVNENGFRGRMEDSDKQVVLFLGSSVTFGWGVRAADSFPALIEKKLEESGHADWTTINAGVPGYSSYQIVKYLEEITEQLRPRIIVVEMGINDGVWSPGFPDKETAAALEDSLPARFVRNSNLLFVVARQLRGDPGPAKFDEEPAPTDRFFYTGMYVPGDVRVPEEDFHSNIARLEEIARETGAEIYFIFPGLYNEYGEEDLAKSVRYSHPREIDLVDAISTAANARRTKLSEYFLPYDEAHLSVKGHRVAAECIWERLSRDANLKNAASSSSP